MYNTNHNQTVFDFQKKATLQGIVHYLNIKYSYIKDIRYLVGYKKLSIILLYLTSSSHRSIYLL